MIKNKKKPIIFISEWRSLPLYELISYFFVFSSVPMLAYGINPYDSEMIKIIVFSVISLYSGFFSVLIWNDITDKDIDKISHPDRPIPSKKISVKNFFTIAVIFSISTFLFAFLISIWCLIITILAAVFVTIHNKFLKKHIKIPAYSEIFTPIQWVVVGIFGYFAIWASFNQIDNILNTNIYQSTYEIYNLLILIGFIYFTISAHDIPEGIVDAKGDRKYKVKTYTTTFGEKNASIIALIWYILSVIFSLLLFLRTILSPIFLIFILILWSYYLRYPIRLLFDKNNDIKILAKKSGRKIFDYFLFSFIIIFFDIIIQYIFI